MNAAIIASLLIKFGPIAIDLIQKLAEVWSKPELTPDEVKEICSVARKSYDQYIEEEKAKRLVG